jgi:plasmid stabilization system protein ParE
MLPVILDEDALSEMDAAYVWYESEREGLGDEFAEAVWSTIDRVQERPRMHRRVYRDVRRATLMRFPYSVMYRVDPERIVVISVFHGRRDPAVWQARA